MSGPRKNDELKASLLDLLNTGKASDYELHKMKLHKAVIAARAPQIQEQKNAAAIQALSEGALKQLTYLIYSNEFNGDPTMPVALEVLNLCIKLELKELEQVCNKYVITHLNEKSAYHILNESLKYADLGYLSDWVCWYIADKKLAAPSDVTVSDESKSKIEGQQKEPKLSPPPANFEIKPEPIYDAFKKLYESKLHGDCIVTVNGSKRYDLHTFVLEPKWKYFAENLTKNHALTTKMPISAFEKVLEYFYIGLKDISVYDAVWITSYADEIQISGEKGLIDFCNQKVNDEVRKLETEDIKVLGPNSEELNTKAIDAIPKNLSSEELIKWFVELLTRQQKLISKLQQEKIGRAHV